MQQAGIDNLGTMAAIVNLSPELVEEACKEASSEGIVQPANFNSPGQIVISGSVAGVQKGMEICKQKGAKLVKQLVVSGAFHSPLMLSAREKLQMALDATPIYDAKKPVFVNVSGKPIQNAGDIKQSLLEQVTAPVLWETIIKNMVDAGIEEFVEIGPGKVLQGLVKRIAPQANCIGIETYEQVENYR
jgi:[acyl-carrier-protein] S-malonyltransferase